MEIIVTVFALTNIITIALSVYLFRKLKNQSSKLKQAELNPDGNLAMLNDIVNNRGVVLKVSRVPPQEIFLRSPRDA